LSKETVGLELIRHVLARYNDQIVDLGAQRNVGADAVEDLERFYELKVFAGAEPDRITLTDSEVQRALSTPDFFLVVVSGVEGVGAKPTVRVILDPIRQLQVADTGSVTLAGVRNARSVIYEFDPAY
jgi:hypothetical protein